MKKNSEKCDISVRNQNFEESLRFEMTEKAKTIKKSTGKKCNIAGQNRRFYSIFYASK